MKHNIFAAVMAIVSLSSCAQQQKDIPQMESPKSQVPNPKSENVQLDTATFGAGCFWCVEAQFQMLDGVVKVESGFSGGTIKNPSYKEVCTGNTGHAEVCNIIYDPKKISFEEILGFFFRLHDPTTRNRQGNDVGTQYRSAIFYHGEGQKKTAQAVKEKVQKSGKWKADLTTEIVPATEFYPADDYHQKYLEKHPGGYTCHYMRD